MRYGRLGALLLALCACGDSPTEPADDIAGTWIWVMSEGGILGEQRTPATEGYQARLVFDGLGTVRALRDDAVVATSSYTLEELPTTGPLPVYSVTYQPALQAFPFTALEEQTFRMTDPGTARLEDPCCDRWVHTFSAAPVLNVR